MQPRLIAPTSGESTFASHFDAGAGGSMTGENGVTASPPGMIPAVLDVGPKPSWPESNVTGPLASGYLMPPNALQGALHAVIVWKRTASGSSALTNVSDLPCLTRGT